MAENDNQVEQFINIADEARDWEKSSCNNDFSISRKFQPSPNRKFESNLSVKQYGNKSFKT